MYFEFKQNLNEKSNLMFATLCDIVCIVNKTVFIKTPDAGKFSKICKQFLKKITKIAIF